MIILTVIILIALSFGTMLISIRTAWAVDDDFELDPTDSVEEPSKPEMWKVS
jgi:hypothetical protein